MASCSMASAASAFGLTPNAVSSNTSTVHKSTFLFLLPSKNNATSCTRLVVRASEETAPAAAATAPAEPAAPEPQAAKPPPIGPKRGTKVSSRTSTISAHLSAYEHVLMSKKVLNT